MPATGPGPDERSPFDVCPRHFVLKFTKRGFKFTEIYAEFASVNSGVSTNKLFSK